MVRACGPPVGGWPQGSPLPRSASDPSLANKIVGVELTEASLALFECGEIAVTRSPLFIIFDSMEMSIYTRTTCSLSIHL